MKYLVAVIDGNESIFVFPREVDHDMMAEALQAIRFGGGSNWRRKMHGGVKDGSIIAAGFVCDGVCYGRSETLNLQSRGGDVDTRLLTREMAQ